jgi:hypothetical protein
MNKLYKIATRFCGSLIPSEEAQRRLTQKYLEMYKIHIR